mgnify:CR=1 FL=1
MHELTVWIDFVVVRTLVHFFMQRENVSINRNELSPSPTQPNPAQPITLNQHF